MKIGVRFSINEVFKSGLRKYSEIINDEFQKALQKSVLVVEREAKKNIKSISLIDTGRLMNSITGQVKKNKGVVGSNVEYAAIHEYGGRTKPHVIRPKNKKGLFWPGVAHPVKTVYHPGSKIKEKRYLRGALEKSRTRIQEYMDKATSNIAERIFRRGR